MAKENMSKLERLIQQYCPDGVEYVKLDSVANICRGTRVVKSQLSDKGYPVYQNCLTPMGYFERSNCNAGITFVICGGAAGNVGYTDVECWAADDCEFIIGGHQVINRYIYYYLMTKQNYLLSKVRKASIPRLSPSIIKDLEIPLPPLPVQEEIVRVLDTFTELQAELQAELQKRKQQYNYYLDNLLNFNNINRGGYQAEVRWMKMSEVFEIRNGYTPSKAKKEFWEGGTIPWFRMEDIRQNGRILSDSILHITPKGVKGKGLFKANSFILATTATIGEHALIIVNSLANQQFTNLSICKSLENELSVKYVYYYFFVIDEWCKANTNVSNFASVDMSKFYNLLIPIPSIAEQQRIVAILDRFDTLTTDLAQGLPAEIEKRRQQYEYYRDKLLTFKRKGA